MTVGGVRCLNMATHNYLGFAGNETIEAAAVECIRKFGVGSCGPRAFYGTAGNVFCAKPPKVVNIVCFIHRNPSYS